MSEAFRNSCPLCFENVYSTSAKHKCRTDLPIDRNAFYDLQSYYQTLVSEVKELAKALAMFGEHDWKCLLSCFEAGEPTENGGYRVKYDGQWYQSRPIDETPKCTCGLDKALNLPLISEISKEGK